MKTQGVYVVDYVYLFAGITLLPELLYFDKLVYHKQFDGFFFKGGDGPGSFVEINYRRLMEEIEILSLHDLVEEFDANKYVRFLHKNPGIEESDVHIQNYISNLKILGKGRDQIIEEPEEIMKNWSNYILMNSDCGHSASRAFTSYLTNTCQDQFMPIIYGDRKDIEASNQVSETTLSIILNQFPTLDENNDIQRVIEFKKDKDASLKLLRLRDWVADLSLKNIDEKYIIQKLEYLTKEYEDQITLYKLRFNRGLLETVVVLGADVLGNLVSFQWGKAAKAFFDLNRQKLLLSEAEKKAVGKEVAYIHKVQETFKKQG